jgi:hypothetical protein
MVGRKVMKNLGDARMFYKRFERALHDRKF